MDTASLRLKFTPLLQGALKNQSKCCLEIVPQVSCISNLDKLTWKQETGFIEYNIPMTYKIILRKLQENNNEEIIKTYHSCVDLLLSTTKSSLDLASGDITKIFSDTFILNKLSTETPDEDTNLAKLKKQSPVALQDDVALELYELDNEQTQQNVVINDVSKVESQLTVVKSTENLKCDKFTNTENVYPLFAGDIIANWPVRAPNKFVMKRKLSVSPICSISTQEKTNLIRSYAETKQMSTETHDSQKELVPITRRISDTSITEMHHYNTFVPDRLSGGSSIKSVRFTPSDRSPPEIRIAKYINYMEKELLPLNLSLNELIKKCTRLGLHECPSRCINTPNSKVLLYKSVCMCNNHITTETCEKMISNRAVYTIVFDG